jgi:hypothetical protein
MTKPNWHIEIYTVEQLNSIRNDLQGRYRLMADIDLAGEAWIPIGTNAAPFAGVLDGNGFSIMNLNINLSTQDNIGLFGRNNGVIRNLAIEGGRIFGGNSVGSLAGFNAGEIINCTVREIEIVSGSGNIGGLVGQNTGRIVDGAVEDIGTVTGTGSNIGSFVGSVSGGTISRSYATVNVNGNRYTGGFVGEIAGGIIEQCYATGNVNATGTDAGGFAGRVSGTTAIIRNCFSLGNVVMGNNTAGFVGIITSGRVENSYSLANNFNGFDFNGTAINCYFDNSLLLSPTTRPGARTTEQMMSRANYIDWDFDTIWEIDEGKSYPYLKGIKNPFALIEIYTPNDLDGIRNSLFGNYRLMADIDLEGVTWTPIGTISTPFIGVLDGNGFSIMNLNINLSTQDNIGLFGRNSGVIHDLTLEGGTVRGRGSVGSLVGYNTGEIINCTVRGITDVNGSSNIGGLVGQNTGSITDSAVESIDTVTGSWGIGGFVGGVHGGTISRSYATVNVTGVSHTGGFVGDMTGGTIEQSYATGNVNATGTDAGGFAGWVWGDTTIIRNCLSIGNVVMRNNTAGFAGDIVSGRIENSYSLASNINGFSLNTANVTNCYFDRDLLHLPTTREGARTTEQMMSQANYVGWDFDTIWEIEEGKGYPTLQGIKKPYLNIIFIYTVEQLDKIRNDLLSRYRLMADIDLDGITWMPIGTSDAPFVGILDGNGFAIKNLTIDLPDQDYVGLFGHTSGIIMNLRLEDTVIRSRRRTGGLAGINEGNILNCTVENATIYGDWWATGGLIGENRGDIVGSAVKGRSEIIAKEGVGVGGFVGYNIGNISKSFSTANVFGEDCVGGFVGIAGGGGMIKQCYATGNVNAFMKAGGFAGTQNGNNTIRNSFSIGNVVSAGGDTGGFVGNHSFHIENSYSISPNANGFSYNGGEINSFFNSDFIPLPKTKANARTTEQMMRKANYVGWDFDNIWEIDEGRSYPTLRGMEKPQRSTEYVNIHTAEQFNNIRNDLLGLYRLMEDIDLTGIEWIPIGSECMPFGGIIDGNGYTIRNLHIDLPNQDYVGLFGYNKGIIVDLSLEKAVIKGGENVGSLIGRNNGHIRNCAVNAITLSGNKLVGGLIGFNGETEWWRGNSYGIIDRSSVADVTFVQRGSYIGGFVGENMSVIMASRSSVDVHGDSYIGGFVGRNSGDIDQCYATGKVNGDNYVGGFVGENSGVIRDCFSTGNTIGVTNTAGFAGYNVWGNSSKIINCYSTANNVNGFVSWNGGTIMNCYFDSDLIGGATTLLEARTTSEMMQASTFVGWDFYEIWAIEEGVSYPTLRIFNMTEAEVNLTLDKRWLEFNVIRNTNESESELRADLLLPAMGQHGTSISWVSNNPAIISNSGDVARPQYGEPDMQVKLTAELKNGGFSYTRIFNLTVKAIAAETPTITEQPKDTTVYQAETAELTVTANISEGTLSYQWFENAIEANKGGSAITGAVQANYTPPTNTVGMRYYYCVITNTHGNDTASAVSDVVTMIVIAVINAEMPSITTQPSDATVIIDDTVELAIEANVSNGTLSYQWYENTVQTNGGGILIPGAVQSSYRPSTNAAGTRYYYCVVTNTDATVNGNAVATVVSRVASVTVSEADTYSIILDISGAYSFESVVEGYGTQGSLTVHITNTGTGDVTGLSVMLHGDDIDSFVATQPLRTELSNSETTTFTITPKTGLLAGRYTADAIATGNNGILASFNISFTIGERSTSSVPTPSPEPIPDPSPEPAPENENILVNGQPSGTTFDSDGVLRVTFTKEDVERYSDESGEYNITISNHMNIIVFISISALQTDDLAIKTDFGAIHIPNAMLTAISELHGDMLRLIIKRGSFYVILADELGNEVAYYDPANPFRLVLPYELKDGQASAAVIAIGNDGRIIPFAIYKDGVLSFDTAETGLYDIIYNQKNFSDVSNHWSEGYIDFVAARALYSGYGNGLFDPDGNMTRAMFVQVLANLEGVDLSAYTVSRFIDVSDNAWYMAAIEWAADMGIVVGVGDSRFDPNAFITREQMAVMLTNYIRHKGFALITNVMSTVFADEDVISEWAFDAVKSIQALGIVGGKPGNVFDPGATATRAEAAAIFTRLIMIVAHSNEFALAS